MMPSIRDKINSTVFTIHGMVETRDPSLLSHRNFLDSGLLESHLRNRDCPYVDLESALKGKGDALTIDDNTVAAGNVATLARRYGHQVTLFVNPFNAIERKTYFFALVCLLIDRSQKLSVTIDHREFPLTTKKGKTELRNLFKKKYLALRSETERDKLVESLGKLLEVDDFSPPEYFQTLDVHSLKKLRQLGVNIGNHGWTHGSVDALSDSEVVKEITQARQWIAHEFSIVARNYAVPFGLSKPRKTVAVEVCENWLLCDNRFESGYLESGVYNRKTLKLKRTS